MQVRASAGHLVSISTLASWEGTAEDWAHRCLCTELCSAGDSTASGVVYHSHFKGVAATQSAQYQVLEQPKRTTESTDSTTQASAVIMTGWLMTGGRQLWGSRYCDQSNCNLLHKVLLVNSKLELNVCWKDRSYRRATNQIASIPNSKSGAGIEEMGRAWRSLRHPFACMRTSSNWQVTLGGLTMLIEEIDDGKGNKAKRFYKKTSP